LAVTQATPCVVGLDGATGLDGVLAGAVGATIRDGLGDGLADGPDEGRGLAGDATPDCAVH
jgi:hypothetical protein